MQKELVHTENIQSEEENTSMFSFNPIKFFFYLLSWWPVILICLVLGFGIAFVIDRYKTDIYRSELILNVESEQKNSLLNGLGNTNGMIVGQDNYNFEKEVYFFKSETLNRQVVKKLCLNEEYFHVGNVINAQTSPQKSPIRIIPSEKLKKTLQFEVELNKEGAIALHFGEKKRIINATNQSILIGKRKFQIQFNDTLKGPMKVVLSPLQPILKKYVKAIKIEGIGGNQWMPSIFKTVDRRPL